MDKKVSRSKAIGLGVMGAVVCSMITGMTVASVMGAGSTAQQELKSVYSSLNELQQLVDERFVGEYDMQNVEDYVLAGYVNGLGDRWSYYMTEEAFEEYQTDNKDTRVGIGVTVNGQTNDDGETELVVQRVTPGSPAEAAGFGSYDRIVAVNGKGIDDLGGYEAAVNEVRGDDGTDVTMTVVDYDTGEKRDLTVTRGEFEQISVTSKMLDDGIGQVTILQFASETDEQFIAAVDDLIAQGAERLIFDLRGNPGGSLDSLVECLDYLLPEGRIISLVSKAGKEEVYDSDADEIDLPMAVLVDEDSYSAAEFFAEALREYDKAQIIGEKTCGKGYSQSVYPLSGGGAVGLSSNCYYTPDGDSLIGKGVEPDVECSLTDEQKERYYVLTADEDPQIQAAIKAVKDE